MKRVTTAMTTVLTVCIGVRIADWLLAPVFSVLVGLGIVMFVIIWALGRR